MISRIMTVVIVGTLVGVLIFAIGYAVKIESVRVEKEKLDIEYSELERQLKEAKNDCEFENDFADKIDYYNGDLIDLQQFYQQQNDIVKVCTKVSITQKKIDEFKAMHRYP